MKTIPNILSAADVLGTGFLPYKKEDWWFAIGNEKYWKRNKKNDLLISFTSIGGHVEQGEGMVDATLREVKEETGINAIITSANETYFIEGTIVEGDTFNFQIDNYNKINVEETLIPWIIYKAKTKDGLLGVVVYQGKFESLPFPQAEVPALIRIPPKLLGKCPTSLNSLLTQGAKLLEQKNELPKNAIIYPFGSAKIIQKLSLESE